MFTTIKKIHFVGIGGIGMSGIAEILLNQGFEITGSDVQRGENIKYLEKKAIKIFIGHKSSNIGGAEVVVYSSAVNPLSNPETVAATQLNIPIIRRAEMLAEAARLNYCLAVAGTHGKTTTTSIVALIMIRAGFDPTVIVGGRLKDFGGTNARLGKGDWTVVEADEYDRSFLQLSPTIAVINNIELEHIDIYADLDDIKATFTEFANKVPFYGLVALGMDDIGVKDIMTHINKNIVTFGLSKHADVRATDVKHDKTRTTCNIVENGVILGELVVNIAGLHNLKNALAATAVARRLGIDFPTICSAIADFKGVYRRFDIKGEKHGVLVVDDYAHHPTEVEAALDAAQNGFNRRVVCVFQPHTYSRTKELCHDFGSAFDNADLLIVTDVYPARELPIEGVTGRIIADAVTERGHKSVTYMPELDAAYSYVKRILREGDILITLGAGNVCDIAERFMKD
jgi:UDP-N-acetylmuramate--alanine ligase